MYSEENYFWGVVAYVLGVLLVCPAMIKVTGFIMPWRPLRDILRVFFITLLFTPVLAYNDSSFMAPAWTVALFEIVRPTSPEGPAAPLALLASVFAGLSLLTIGFHVYKFFWRRRQVAQPQRQSPSYYRQADEVADERGDDYAADLGVADRHTHADHSDKHFDEGDRDPLWSGR
jgi:hypothetical protein